MSLFHINTCSFSKNVEELEYLRNKIKIDFDVTGISESRIKKDKSPINSINLKGCSHKPCPTESAAGTLCYTLVIIFPTILEMIYVFTDQQN